MASTITETSNAYTDGEKQTRPILEAMPSPIRSRRFHARPATPDDAEAAAALYRDRAAGLPGAPLSGGEFERLIQTGNAFLVAERGGGIAGAARYWEDDGIGWLDLLVSGQAGAGPELLRAVERRSQDRGLRLVRMRVLEASRLPDVFARFGYLPISREREPDGAVMLVLEKRLALLTVREQRREDAAAIGELTGEDPWVFEQGTRPGWFVAADGDRVVGVIGVRDAKGGLARLSDLAIRPEYGGRNLDVWMIERAATWAETHGYHSAELADTEGLRPLRRALEDRRWHIEGEVYVKRFHGREIEDGGMGRSGDGETGGWEDGEN